jgi:hypothetical protein
MDLMPTSCASCGGRMSTPLAGRRTGLLMSTCRDCGTTVHSATPQVADSVKPISRSTTAPEPARVKPGALDRFQRAAIAGTLREAIRRSRAHAAAAAAIDPKLKQLGEVDR